MNDPINPEDADAGRTRDAEFRQRDWLETTLPCICDGVITTDADFQDGVLTLAQPDAPALAGTVVNLGEKQFGFELLGGPQAATIQFSR